MVKMVSEPHHDDDAAAADDEQYSHQHQHQHDPRHRHWQWFAGAQFSGAPFHSHAPAFNFLVRGAKYWLLTPPGNS